MKTIVISGPSGSGKSILSSKLFEFFDDSIVIKTDSYYRDNILIRFLSIFICDIYDRPISIKKDDINNTLKSLYNKERIISFSQYNFKTKKSSQSKKRIDYKGDNQFIILEGIFSHRLDLNYKETINIVCEENKEICFNRRLKRDKLERGRDSREVIKKFRKSWYLFYKNIQNYLNNNKIMVLKPLDNASYNKLVINLEKIKKLTKKNN